MKSLPLITMISLLAATSAAQSFTLRGDVEDVQGTANQFFLNCTNISLVSNAIDLRTLVGQGLQHVMTVRDVSTPTRTVLEVLTAQATQKTFDMGNIRLGRTDRWEAFAAPGSQVHVFLTHTDLTGMLPLGAAGTWLMGGLALPVRSGVTNQLGQFQFNFGPPNLPALVGQSFSAQAVIVDTSGFWLTNADCKEVRAN